MDDVKTQITGLEDPRVFEASLIGEDEPHAPASPAGEPPVQPRWVGKVLGHFKLLRILGEGTMGLVVQAEDVNLRRIVALKILRRRITGMDETQRVNQFLREARSASQIEHPNVVHIYEINQTRGWWYIAMEMLEGGSLASIVKAAGPLTPARACPIIADAATALAVAHTSGIIHRDIKPTNLMLTRTGRCKVTDFGLVRVDDPNDPFDFTNKAVGSPHYMAPEVLHNAKPSPAMDVYSLGATLYYALTGHPPYVGQTVKRVLAQHALAEPPDVRQHAPHCPESLARIVRRAMAKDPDQRPSAAQFAAALRAEAIGTTEDSASVVGLADGSSLIIESSFNGARAAGAAFDHDPSASGLHPHRIVVSTRRDRRTAWIWMLVGAGAASMILALALFGGRIFQSARRTPLLNRPRYVALADAFPSAPASYGQLPPGAVPVATHPAVQPPPFSWVGKVNTKGLRFVASRQGRHYFPIDDPLAALISLDNFVGYQSATQAQADDKTPAP